MTDHPPDVPVEFERGVGAAMSIALPVRVEVLINPESSALVDADNRRLFESPDRDTAVEIGAALNALHDVAPLVREILETFPGDMRCMYCRATVSIHAMTDAAGFVDAPDHGDTITVDGVEYVWLDYGEWMNVHRGDCVIIRLWRIVDERT